MLVITSPTTSILPFILVKCFDLYVQVQWDEPSSIPKPDRVSPWELEPLLTTTPTSQLVVRNKRPRLPASSVLTTDATPTFGNIVLPHLFYLLYLRYLLS